MDVNQITGYGSAMCCAFAAVSTEQIVHNYVDNGGTGVEHRDARRRRRWPILRDRPLQFSASPVLVLSRRNNATPRESLGTSQNLSRFYLATPCLSATPPFFPINCRTNLFPLYDTPMLRAEIMLVFLFSCWIESRCIAIYNLTFIRCIALNVSNPPPFATGLGTGYGGVNSECR